MINLLKIEFIKVRKNKYFIGSFLGFALIPLIAFAWMTSHPGYFQLGDYNRFNVFVMSMFASRFLFPLIAMSMIVTGNGLNSIRSAFLSPYKRKMILFSKVFFAFVWMTTLLIFSSILVVVVEFVLFRDVQIIGIVVQSSVDYFMIILYAFPFQIIGMLLALIFNNLLIPTIAFVTSIGLSYGLILFSDGALLSVIVPASIFSHVEMDIRGWGILFCLYLIGVLSYFVLDYKIRNKEYIE